MKKNLIILSEFFPYLNKETFLETEIYYYENCNVNIFACSANNSMSTREINQLDINYFAEDKEENKFRKAIGYIKSLFSADFLNEIIVLIKNKKLNSATILQLLSFISVAKRKYKWIKRELISSGMDESTNVVFYSYWMHYHAYTALLLKKFFVNSKVITRCHRFDLYEYSNPIKYIPLRKKILSQLDEIHSISQDGINYLKTNYPEIRMNIKVSRLGTHDYGWIKETPERITIKMVSCSWVEPVKRVERIISSLEKINDIVIEWSHYGDGQLLNEIKKLADQKLQNKSNIKYMLWGALSNQEILRKYYDEQYHLFVNVSESEGIPVSIMEATSFGMPVVAADVGGVREVIKDGENGFLLDKDFTDEQLVEAIKKISTMNDNEYLKLRQTARDLWKTKYDAEKNYMEFVGNI